MKTTCLIFSMISSIFPGVAVHRISTILRLPTEMGDRSEFLVIVVIDLLYVIPGVILPTEKKNKPEGVA